MDLSTFKTDLEPFRIEVQREPDAARVVPIGELDLATVDTLAAQLHELQRAGCRHIVLDLSQLSFMDSTGLKLILAWNARARQGGTELTLIAGPRCVQRVFEVSGALEHLTFAHSPVGLRRD